MNIYKVLTILECKDCNLAAVNYRKNQQIPNKQTTANTCGSLTFFAPPHHTHNHTNTHTHPEEEVTFWIALQVGKISNWAYLHMADRVHTSFVWREWFPPGPLAGLSLLLWDPGDREAPSCTSCGSSAPVTASWLTAHISLWLYLSTCLLLSIPHSSFPLSSALEPSIFKNKFKLQHCMMSEQDIQQTVPLARLDWSLKTFYFAWLMLMVLLTGWKHWLTVGKRSYRL